MALIFLVFLAHPDLSTRWRLSPAGLLGEGYRKANPDAKLWALTNIILGCAVRQNSARVGRLVKRAGGGGRVFGGFRF